MKKNKKAPLPMSAAAVQEEVRLNAKNDTVTPKRKNRLIGWLPLIIAALIVLLIAIVIPARLNRARNQSESDNIVSAEAAPAEISTDIHAGGTLTDEEAESVTLPTGITLNWQVENGDTVAAGDLLATVDKTEVMTCIASLQESIDNLDEQIEAAESGADTTITAPTDGRVKAVYASAGTAVSDTLYQNGSLMILSLDGLMAVDLENTDASVGDSVTVTLSDGTKKTGRVAGRSGSIATVTLTDDGPAMGDSVTVTSADGTELGTGTLYIHSQLNVTAYNGTVKAVKVTEGKKVSAGDTLMTLTGVSATAGSENMLSQRQKMTDQLQTLFELYQTGGLYAENDGIVEEISDEDDGSASAAVTAAAGAYSASLLSNTPDGSDDSGYINRPAKVTANNSGTLQLLMAPSAVSEVDYGDASALSGYSFSEAVTYPAADAQVYISSDGGWQPGSVDNIRVGDIIVLAFDGNSEDAQLVWIVCHHTADTQETPAEIEPPVETAPAESMPAESMPMESFPTESMPSESQLPSGSDTSDSSSFDFSSISGSISGDISTFSGLTGDAAVQGQEQTVVDTAALSEEQVCVITPNTSMTITMSIDEHDLLKLSESEEVTVELNALSGESVTGTITSISAEGTNSGGSTKYSAVVTVDRTEEMRSGMNAAVTIPVSVTQAAVTLPAAALQEENGTVVVYTGYNEKKGELTDPVEVTTGVSDGETVEILSGLEDGTAVYYEYIDTISVHFGL